MNNYFSVVKEYLTIKKLLYYLKLKLLKNDFSLYLKKKMSNKKRISATKKSSKIQTRINQ